MSGAENKAGQAVGKADCFGLPVWRSKLQEVHKAFYWGGGVYGDSDGPEGDFNKALARFTVMGAKCPECRAAEFIGMVPAADRSAETFKAYCNWHRQQRPDEYDQPSLVRILSRCAQIEHQAETGGRDAGYGTWFATLSILKFSDGGDDDAAIEELTGRHADYCPNATAAKMHSISAPHRCKTFDENEAGICDECRFFGRITSPIALGFKHEPRGRVEQ